MDAAIKAVLAGSADSINRAALTKENFKNYFDLLDTVLEENNRNWRKLHSGRLPELLLVLARRQKEDPTQDPKVKQLIWVIPFPSIPRQILCNVSLLSLQTLYQLVCLVPSH